MTTGPVREAAAAVVVLAAGRGSRLAEAGARVPKWLLPVAGRPIARYHLDALAAVPSAWSRLVVVAGHARDQLDVAELSAQAGRPCELVENPDYATVNNWLSLALALDYLHATGWDGPVCTLNSDLLLPPARLAAVLERAAAGPEESLLVTDSRRRLSDEAMKVVAPDGAIRDIGKTGLRGTPTGEFIGAAVLAAGQLPALRRILAGFAGNAARRDEWYEGAFRQALEEGLPFAALEVETADWVEIDDGRDLRTAAEIAVRYAV